MERADHCAGGGVRQTRDPLARTGMGRGRTVVGSLTESRVSVDYVISRTECPLLKAKPGTHP